MTRASKKFDALFLQRRNSDKGVNFIFILSYKEEKKDDLYETQ